MAHRFVPRKGPRKEPAQNDPLTPKDEDQPVKDLLGKDLLANKDLLGKSLPERAVPSRGRRTFTVRREVSGGGLSWLYVVVFGIAGVGLAGGLIFGYIYNQVPGYVANVKVQGPTRLDWFFVLERKSTEPPPLWSSFDSPRQSTYELYVPPSHEKSTAAYPLVLFLSPGAKPVGWKPWSSVCKEKEQQEQGVIFAGLKNAGAERPMWQRARMVLDVLDDVRKKYRVDPDRTYLVGIGDTGPLACRTAFALPELFGGVVAIGNGDFLRDEPYLRQRASDRLSVALVASELDNNRAEMDLLFGALLKDVGVRTKVWDVSEAPGEVPGPATMAEIFAWLEEAAPKRQELAQRYPAMHFTGDTAPTREEWARLLLVEGQQRLQAPATLYSGMIQRQGCANRWEGLAAAREAGVAFGSHQASPEFKAEQIADRRKHDRALVNALTSYLTTIDAAGLHRNLQRNEDWGRKVIQLWEQLAEEFPDTAADAKKHIGEVQQAINRPLPPRERK